MSLRQSFLTKRYSNFFYFDHARFRYTHTHLRTYIYNIWATVCQSQHEVKMITVCQAFYYEFRRERKPDFAEEESVGLLKALRRGRRD